MATYNDLRKELEPYKNTLVLDFFEVVRLVDVVQDDDDFYWVYDTPNGIKKSSCTTNWKPLKGYLKDNDYHYLVRIWNYNNIIKCI